MHSRWFQRLRVRLAVPCRVRGSSGSAAGAGLLARPSLGADFPIDKMVGKEGSAVAVFHLIFLSGLKILSSVELNVHRGLYKAFVLLGEVSGTIFIYFLRNQWPRVRGVSFPLLHTPRTVSQQSSGPCARDCGTRGLPERSALEEEA